MFCHKCGTQIAKGSAFCHRCGTEVVYNTTDSPRGGALTHDRGKDQQQIVIMPTGTESPTNQLSVILVEVIPAYKVRAIKLVRELTGFGLAESKALVEKTLDEQTPVLLKKSVTLEEAVSIKETFINAGADVTFTDQNGNFVEVTTHSEECDTVLKDDNSDNAQDEKAPTTEYRPSKIKSWWNKSPTVIKVLATIAALLIGICILVEFGYLLFGIAVIGGFVLTLTTGSEKEKIETRRAIVQMVITLALVIVVAIVVVLKPDFVSNIFQPGAEVRNAYLTQYSDRVTIGEVFDNFFANGKWSTYKAEGYSYVVFTGVCEYAGEDADVRLTFKITGEHFRTDSLDINGIEQSDFILALMLAKVYEDY